MNDNNLILEQLVEEHFEYLYKYAFRYFRNHDKAQDLVQETYLAATDAITRFQGKSSHKTWLVSILRFKIMDQFKRERGSEVLEFIAKDEESTLFDQSEHWSSDKAPTAWGKNPDEVLSEKEFFSALKQCLHKLPSHLRQIFMLKEVDGFAREEIAKQLELTSSNVGVILHRARLNLQQCLQKSWFSHGGSAK